MYKFLKLSCYDKFGKDINPTAVFFFASFVAECITILVHFPYDMIKCRLQSKNYIFKYKNLPHAFRKEIKENGIGGLYVGVTPFLATYTTFVAL